ncbi:MAG: DNA recombination protein RmuC [Bacteroidales bacterium]|nr:DNA recombination protein RmuC [Bacteroidales bacterium]MDD4684611.1 DNA recombination protein RmuC [Bacteroidales bacterium]
MEIALAMITLGLIIAVIIMALMLSKKKVETNLELESDYKLLESRYSQIESSSKELEVRYRELESNYNLVERENSSLKTDLRNKEENLNKEIEKNNIISRQFEDIRNQFNDLKSSNNVLLSNIRNKEELLNKELEKNAKLTSLLEEETKKSFELSNLNSTLKANNEAIQKKQEEIKDEFDKLQKQAKTEFVNLANEILKNKTSEFTETNKLNIENLLKPLDLSIKAFRENVNTNLTEETKQRSLLQAEIKKVMEQTTLVSEQANNLASALKGENKKAGNWGENVLETILQNTGLIKGEHYITQDVHRNEDDKKIIPDVVVYLPDNRKVIIDSKVSLVNYDNYFSAEAEEDQKKELTKHIASVRNHINELSQKKYDDIKGSLGFVMMFVPIESAYLLAMQNDRTLWDFAYNKNVVLVSSTTLISSLRIFADLWRTDKLNKNAERIIEDSGKMYEKFVGFLESFEDVGKKINTTNESYNKAFNQLKSGNGNLIKRAKDIQALGVKTMKSIPEIFEDYDE